MRVPNPAAGMMTTTFMGATSIVQVFREFSDRARGHGEIERERLADRSGKMVRLPKKAA